MGSRHHNRTRDRVLVAGDVDDLAAIRHVLALLPDDAYGQVFIEVLDARDIVPIPAPPRVTVTFLTRVTRESHVRPLAFAARGETLTRAVVGWVGEWMPGDDSSEGVSLMWIGCAGNAHVTALYDLLHARLPGLSTLPDLSRPAL